MSDKEKKKADLNLPGPTTSVDKPIAEDKLWTTRVVMAET